MREKETKLQMIEAPDRFTTARIWYCKYQSLAFVSSLENLKTLVIAGLPESNLEFIKDLSKLKYLSITHMPKLNSITEVSQLTDLESLSLATSPSWDSSGKLLKIQSLSPIGKLRRLKHIELFGVLTESKSLKELETCESLVSGRFSKYPKKETERFAKIMKISQDFLPEPVYEML